MMLPKKCTSHNHKVTDEIMFRGGHEETVREDEPRGA
jgi:hypothetical protein